MADDRMAVLETVRKAISEGDADSLREGVRVLARAVMEAEVTELTGAPRGGRNPEARLTHRNGCRERRRDTRAGTIGPAVPRVRDGSCLPSLLEPRRRVEPALLAVVSEAHVAGVSTRRVEDPVEALGIASMSRSEVSRICAALDDGVEASRTRPLDAGAGHPVEQLAEVVAVLAAGPVGHDRRRGARKSSNRSARSRDASHRGAGGRSGEWWAAMGGGPRRPAPLVPWPPRAPAGCGTASAPKPWAECPRTLSGPLGRMSREGISARIGRSKPPRYTNPVRICAEEGSGAGDGIRTRDILLGKS